MSASGDMSRDVSERDRGWDCPKDLKEGEIVEWREGIETGRTGVAKMFNSQIYGPIWCVRTEGFWTELNRSFGVFWRRPQTATGCGTNTCTRCNLVNEYAEPVVGYVCYECRS